MTRRATAIEELAGRIDSLTLDHPVRVAIDGVDAAGKTVLADELAENLSGLDRNVIRASVDGFHNPSSIRRRRGPDSPEGYFLDSFDYESLRKNLLDPLGPDGSGKFKRAVFNFRTDKPVDSPGEEAAPDSILIFDGVFLLRPELRACWDFSIFVRAEFSTTIRRALDRDAELFGSNEEALRRYNQRYVPGQEIYLSRVQPEDLATAVFDNDDPTSPTIHYAPS